MPERELDAFVESATASKVCAICLDGLRKAGERLGTAIPARVLQSLGEAGHSEPSAILLGKGPGRRMLADFLGLPGWPERLRWLRELAFPAADYMRWKYPEAAASSLPVLHLRRGISALARLFSPSGKGM